MVTNVSNPPAGKTSVDKVVSSRKTISSVRIGTILVTIWCICRARWLVTLGPIFTLVSSTESVPTP